MGFNRASGNQLSVFGSSFFVSCTQWGALKENITTRNKVQKIWNMICVSYTCQERVQFANANRTHPIPSQNYYHLLSQHCLQFGLITFVITSTFKFKKLLFYVTAQKMQISKQYSNSYLNSLCSCWKDTNQSLSIHQIRDYSLVLSNLVQIVACYVERRYIPEEMSRKTPYSTSMI